MQIKKFSPLFEAFFFFFGGSGNERGGEGNRNPLLTLFLPKQFLIALNYNLDMDHVLRELHMVSIPKMWTINEAVVVVFIFDL